MCPGALFLPLLRNYQKKFSELSEVWLQGVGNGWYYKEKCLTIDARKATERTIANPLPIFPVGFEQSETHDIESNEIKNTGNS